MPNLIHQIDPSGDKVRGDRAAGQGLPSVAPGQARRRRGHRRARGLPDGGRPVSQQTNAAHAKEAGATEEASSRPGADFMKPFWPTFTSLYDKAFWLFRATESDTLSLLKMDTSNFCLLLSNFNFVELKLFSESFSAETDSHNRL
jgi:hypothetical protein